MSGPNNSTDSAESLSARTVGWREWISLPDLALPAIKAKVDTGARTSTIHAFDIERYKDDNGTDHVAFSVNPVQRDTSIQRRCHAPLIDIRRVTDSGGHSQERFFIQTTLIMGDYSRVIELTLAQRKDMLFRMLLGRTTLVPNLIVDPQLSYTFGRLNARALYADNAPGMQP